MDKYTIISPESKGTFNDRLNYLYLALGNYLDKENLEKRKLQYCKVFLSDSKNQIKELTDSLVYQEYIQGTNCTVVEQPPLNGSKISLLIKTTDDPAPLYFCSLRLSDEEAKEKDSYEQTRLLFQKYLDTLNEGMTMERNLIRTWIYVTDIDANYQGVVKARNDLFAQQGLTPSTHYIASTGIGGSTPINHSMVAIDFLTIPDIQATDIHYLQAVDYLNPTHEYGVAFERGTRISFSNKQQFFISGTASIDKYGQIVYEGDIVRQTGRLLENIGALLKDGNATMKDIKYFIIYLRDLSDYNTVEQMMLQFYPQIPHIIVEARVCRPGWLIEMECIAETNK